MSQGTGLRPQSVGQLLDDTFRSFRNHFRFIATATLCVYLPYLILEAIFAGNVLGTLSKLQTAQTTADITALMPELIPQFIGAVIVGIVSALLVVPLLYGTLLNFFMGQKFHGKCLSFKEAFMNAWGRLLAAIGTGLLKWLFLVLLYVVIVIVIAVVAAIFSAANAAGAAMWILIVLLSLAAICVLIWLSVKLSITMSVALAERRAGFGALVRSWLLVRGNFWRVFGFFLLLKLIVGAVSFGLSMIFNFLPAALGGILDNLVTLVTEPFTLIATALLYLDLRVRTDAPDLEEWLDRGGSTEQQ